MLGFIKQAPKPVMLNTDNKYMQQQAVPTAVPEPPQQPVPVKVEEPPAIEETQEEDQQKNMIPVEQYIVELLEEIRDNQDIIIKNQLALTTKVISTRGKK